MSTVSEQPTRRIPLPTGRGRRKQDPIDAAARRVIARKDILAASGGRVRECKEVCPR